MKIWGGICLLAFITEDSAYSMEKFDAKEERAGIAVSTHFDEDNFQKASSTDHKAESSPVVRESSESFLSSKEAAPEPYMIVTTEKVSPPGGGVPMLDPKAVSEIIIPPFPKAETSWWDRWMDAIVGFFEG